MHGICIIISNYFFSELRFDFRLSKNGNIIVTFSLVLRWFQETVSAVQFVVLIKDFV